MARDSSLGRTATLFVGVALAVYGTVGLTAMGCGGKSSGLSSNTGAGGAADESGGSTGAAGRQAGASGGGGSGAGGNLDGAGGGATAVSPWAAWPMPNNPADVADGAPNPESYADNGDGTVTDNVTGLMWQQSGPFPSLAQSDAIASCLTLALGDHHDWRLPTMIELMSIIAYGSPGAIDAATINATFFPSTPRGDFWSATAPSAASTAWTVSFGNGGYFAWPATQPHSVRCVRTASVPPAGSRYAITDSTVHDNGTMLTWQRMAPAARYVWVEARDYCSALGATLGGSGWRLPAIKELITIFDPSQASTTTADIDATAFPGTTALGYWSATLNTSSIPIGSVRSLVNFGGGGVVAGDTSTDNSVRCVR